jgi:cyclic beta-1,2-glucan synthetase
MIRSGLARESFRVGLRIRLQPGRQSRVANTRSDTLGKLQRERGHFYNWYDTQTLQPLVPHYVSTVDSGNLCAHLLTAGERTRRAAGTSQLRDRRLWTASTMRVGVLVETPRRANTDGAIAQFRTRLQAARQSGRA